MMGSGRTNEKGKAPAYASSISLNAHPPSGVAFLEGNVDEDNFDSILDMPFSIAGWEDIHRSVAPGVPETIRNPRVYSTGLDSFQNPQINLSTNSFSTNLQEVPLLPEWNMGWGQQCMNQGKNGLSSAGIRSFGGESSFGSFYRPQVNRDVTGSSFVYRPIDTAPVQTRNNANFNTNRSGLQGKFEGSFLSLGLGGTSETVSSSQLDSRQISDKLKEAASNELKITHAQKPTGQTFDDGFMGSPINNSVFSNQSSHVSRMTSTKNEFGSHGSLNSGLGSSRHRILPMPQNGRQLGRADKLIQAPSTELKMVNSRKATGQNQTLDADAMGFQRNNSGVFNQFSNVDRVTSTNYEVGDRSMLNSEPCSSRQSNTQMQQSNSRNIRDIDHYKVNQSVHSATLGGNSAHFFDSQQHNLNPPGFVKPSWMTSDHTPSEQLQYFHSSTANSPNYAGQVISQNATPTQVRGGNLFSQKTTIPQVSWVGSGPADIDAPFPKRLGVESSVRNSPQGHLSLMGTNLQTTNTGEICQFSDKGSTHMPHNIVRPVGGINGASVSYPVNYQEPSFTYGQSQNALIQLPKGPEGVPSTSASSVDSQSQRLDFHVRPHHKRTAAAPQSAPRWVRRQKIGHPSVHHSLPKPPIPVTTAPVPPIPVRSRTHAGPVTARIPPVIPSVSNVKPRVPVASAPAVSHITWKDPDATYKLSGHKCFLCKRDLALTSEGPVFQPMTPPLVAVLPCGHTFHDQCLQNITPDDQAKDPPCIPCAIGEN